MNDNETKLTKKLQQLAQLLDQTIEDLKTSREILRSVEMDDDYIPTIKDVAFIIIIRSSLDESLDVLDTLNAETSNLRPPLLDKTYD